MTRPAPVGGSDGAATTYAFDNLFRLTSVSRPSGSEAGGGTLSAVYSGLLTTNTDEVGRQTRTTENAAGR